MTPKTRSFLGYLLAVLIAPFAFWIQCAIASPSPGSLTLTYVFGLPVAAGATLLIGLPSVALEKRGLLTLPSLICIGACAGVLAIANFRFVVAPSWWSLTGLVTSRGLLLALTSAFTGIHAALVFWVVSGRSRAGSRSCR